MAEPSSKKQKIEACSMSKNSKLLVCGSKGLVGGSLMKHLAKQGYTNVVGADLHVVDFTDSAATMEYFKEVKPEFVILAAAKVGGIYANDTFPADFIRINLLIQNSVIEACYQSKVQKLLFLGSSCIYPKLAPQPIKEEYFLSGKLEPTNDAYAIAKIAGIMMCKSYNRQYGTNFIAVMPTNLYGPGDNFNLKGSHVLPAMIRKFHEGKMNNSPTVECWGTGTVCREFIFVEDMVDGLEFMLNHFDGSGDKEDEKMFLNLGTGVDVTIKELAEIVKSTVGYTGEIVWNTEMPDGTPRKLLDVSRLEQLGWKAKTTLPEGIQKAYQWFLENQDNFRS